MKKLISLTLILMITQTCLTAQFSNAVAPLEAGNKWVYSFSSAFPTGIQKFEVTDSVQTRKGTVFYNVDDGGFMGLMSNGFLARYDGTMNDSLYKYFKNNPQKGDTWEQQWSFDTTTLHSTIVDTFSSQVFGSNTAVYVVDRFTIDEIGDTVYFMGSREFWTEEFGRIRGFYEQAEDYLLGCVIDGVVYGDTSTVGVEDEEQLPTEFVLYQNYPNPFNPSTVISWQLAFGSNVQLKIYDLLGREIKTLVNQYYGPGKHNVTFYADGLTSGIYFYKIITDNFSAMNKMMYLK